MVADDDLLRLDDNDHVGVDDLLVVRVLRLPSHHVAAQDGREPQGPRSTGAVEEFFRQLENSIGDRASRMTNKTRTDALLKLIAARRNGWADDRAWAELIRDHLARTHGLAANHVLEIEVVNFWPNRVIGDASLPAEQRITRTNIRKLTKDTPLIESGLLGPVQILEQDSDR